MHHFNHWRSALLVSTLAGIVFGTLPAKAAPWDGRRNQFAAPRFEQVWRDADLDVEQGRTSRSWTWGPGPWFDYKEVYKQSPNGLRQVQYFDKARMEINDPGNTSGPLGGVTNGLLVVEMVSGRIKLGNAADSTENELMVPARIPVAGDFTLDDPANLPVPTYETFKPLSTTDNGYRDPNKVGMRAGTMLNNTGGTSFRADFAAQPGTEIVTYENVTGHNVPRIFEDFRNAGPIPAIAAFGYPITDPYWVEARVGGRPTNVMVQLFERRTLTYTPTNPAPFQVEMGNVGQHYFMWRYGSTPWVTPDPRLPIFFASKRNGSNFNIYAQDVASNTVEPVSNVEGFDLIPSSVARTWTNYPPVIYGSIIDEQNRHAPISIIPGARFPTGLSAQTANTYELAISPDNEQLLSVSDRDGNPEIYLSTNASILDRGVALTSTSNCSNGHPSWLADGTGFVYESNCLDGNWNIYIARLGYTVVTSPDEGTRAQGAIITQYALTSNRADDRWPSVSPDGRSVAFMSTRDGNTEIYTVGTDGQREMRLTNHPARDEGPAWGPDSAQLVFNSNRDGDHELFIMGSGGEGLRQLTHNTVDDGYATWGN